MQGANADRPGNILMILTAAQSLIIQCQHHENLRDAANCKKIHHNYLIRADAQANSEDVCTWAGVSKRSRYNARYFRVLILEAFRDNIHDE
jgi:hypothetical protein